MDDLSAYAGAGLYSGFDFDLDREDIIMIFGINEDKEYVGVDSEQLIIYAIKATMNMKK